jgi:hypothetical protein
MIFDYDTNTIWIRQSWLGTALRCTERGRLAIVAPEWDERSSDSAFCGTSVHYAIEQYLRHAVSIDMLEDVVDAYITANVQPDMAWKKMRDLDHLRNNARNDVRAFREYIAPHVPLGGRTEQSFAVVIDEHRADGWRLGIKGTIDYCAPDGSLWDWKTASRPYKPNEKQKYEVQPSIYALAAIKGALATDWPYRLPLIFNYGVMEHMAKQARPQIVSVIRHQGHIDWAITRINDLVDLALTMGVHRNWPRDDDHFLCNETWCPWWSICKGAHLSYVEDSYPAQIDIKFQ